MNTPFILTFSFDELKITGDMIRELMSNNDTGPVPDSLNAEIDEAIQLGSEKCDISAGYIIDDQIKIDADKKLLYSKGTWFETNKVVTQQLQGSEKAAWFMCTAGKNISSYGNELMQQGDFIKGYAIDLLANIIVEEAAEKMLNTIISDMNARSLKVTNCYSPGYCDWDITEQKKLFNLFPDNFLGITLTESSLMVPIKSTSGIIGIGPDVKFNNNTCNLCSSINCQYRNRRKTETREL